MRRTETNFHLLPKFGYASSELAADRSNTTVTSVDGLMRRIGSNLVEARPLFAAYVLGTKQ